MANDAFQAVTQDPRVRGANMLDLVLFSDEWVHRRVDTLTFARDGESMRSVSLDLTVPAHLKVLGAAQPNADPARILVPLAFIRKGSLRHVSTAGPSKHPFPILERRLNSAIAKEMLLAAIPEAWVQDQQKPHVSEAIENIVKCALPVQNARPSQDLEALLSTPESAADPGQLSIILDLAKTLEDNFLLIGELESKLLGVRSIVKFSHAHDLEIRPQLDYAIAFRYDPPDYGFAASEHVEIAVPSDLTVRLASFEEAAEGNSNRIVNIDAPKFERARAHVSLTPSDRFAAASVTVEVAPSGRGIVPFTGISVAVAGSLSSLAFLEKLHIYPDFPIIHGSSLSSPAVSIILVGPALFLSWLARAPEHDMVARLLGPMRFCLVLCAVVFLGIGAIVAIPFAPDVKGAAWAVVFASAILALVLFLSFSLSIHRKCLAVVDWVGRSWRRVRRRRLP